MTFDFKQSFQLIYYALNFVIRLTHFIFILHHAKAGLSHDDKVREIKKH